MNIYLQTPILVLLPVFVPYLIEDKADDQKNAIFACGALAASISVGIVIPSTCFVYLYKQTVSITVVVMGTKQFSDKTTHRQQYELHLAL